MVNPKKRKLKPYQKVQRSKERIRKRMMENDDQRQAASKN